MTVRQVADKLASFVAKNGRQFEDITRQKNPGDSPFKYDRNSFADQCKKKMLTLNLEIKIVSLTVAIINS